jgi:uncharacterized protein DUF2569
VRRCPECGKDNPGANRFCFCGHNLEAPVQPPPRGVGGWLLFFCIQVVILGPLLMLGTFVLVALSLAGQRLLLTNAGLYILLRAAAGAAVAAVGALAGVYLWMLRPGAVRLARIYLVLLALLPLGLLAVSSLFPVPAGVELPAPPVQVPTTLFSVAGATFWWLYFSNSRRVRATYMSPT